LVHLIYLQQQDFYNNFHLDNPYVLTALAKTERDSREVQVLTAKHCTLGRCICSSVQASGVGSLRRALLTVSVKLNLIKGRLRFQSNPSLAASRPSRSSSLLFQSSPTVIMRCVAHFVMDQRSSVIGHRSRVYILKIWFQRTTSV
jgi:hypothetical protein